LDINIFFALYIEESGSEYCASDDESSEFHNEDEYDEEKEEEEDREGELNFGEFDLPDLLIGETSERGMLFLFLKLVLFNNWILIYFLHCT
jgi:hypothetical protein